MRNNPVSGGLYFWRGLGLIFKPGIRRFVIFPLAVNVLLFGSLIYFGASQLQVLLDWMLPDWLDWLSWLLYPLFLVAALVVVFFTFSLVGNLLAAPFNGLLAEAVERHVTGKGPLEGGWKKLLKDLGLTIVSELRKLGYIVVRGLPLLILFVIPGVNVVAPMIWLVFSAWMLAISFIDYPMANHGLIFSEQRRRLAESRWLGLGFGGAVMFAIAVPLLNFLVIPSAVAGATLLWVERLSQSGAPRPTS